MTNTPDELERAVERLKKYLVERKKSRVHDPIDIHALHIGDEREAVLTVPDLRLLLSERAKLLATVAWRDIATAPRDGREIIAYSQDVSGTTGLNPFVSLCAWHPDAGFCTCELREVTHWMPFPPLPSAERGSSSIGQNDQPGLAFSDAGEP